MESWEHSEHPPGEEPVLDPRVIQMLRDLGERGGEDLLRQLADLFTATSAERTGSLRDALRAHDMTKLIRVAHGLRGSAGALGATRLGRLCATIGASGASENLLDAVQLETDRTSEALRWLGAMR